MLATRQPGLQSVRIVNLGVSPMDTPGWLATAPCAGALHFVGRVAGENHCSTRTLTVPGLSGAWLVEFLDTEFATTTAM